MKTHFLFALALSLVVAPLVRAAEPEFEFPKPQKEHEFLKKFVGEWDTTGEATFPGQPPMTCQGTATGRLLGGFWVVTEGKAEPMGMPMTTIQTIGYDTKKKKYVGTWIDSMMNHMWHYVGTVSDDGKTITLEAEGPNMLEPGKTCKFRDAYTFDSADHYSMSSSMQGADGKWTQFMKGEGKRKK